MPLLLPLLLLTPLVSFDVNRSFQYRRGCVQVEAQSVEEVMTILRTGSMNRTTASTLMNDTSSRSHAVFTITIESTPKDGASCCLTCSASHGAGLSTSASKLTLSHATPGQLWTRK